MAGPVQSLDDPSSASTAGPASPGGRVAEAPGAARPEALGAAGPELAPGPGVSPCRDWSPCAITFPVRRLLVSKLSFGAVTGLVVATLAWSGYPRWRVTVLVAAYLVQALVENLLVALAPKTPDGEKIVWRRHGRSGPTIHLLLFALTATQLAMTGGLASPLVVLYALPFLAGVAIFGTERRTVALGGCTFGVALLLAALPARWVGPRVPSPAFEWVVLASLLVAIGVIVTNVSLVVRALREAQLAILGSREDAAREALARARSLEEVGATVAHELKNPLTAVKALVQLGARNPAEAASRERFETVEREVSRMQDILQDYLSFSRPLRPLAPEPIELAGVVEGVLSAVSGRAEAAGVGLGLTGGGRVEADPRRLEEALLNLVANAIEATPPGGRVDVRVDERDGVASIRVRDTGRGMAPEVLARIGTPFFTTRDEGTGLGVVLARSALVQHGGGLRYESAPGRGTTAVATLPARRTRRGDGPRAARG